MALEKEIAEKLEKAEKMCGAEDPDEMNEKKRKEVLSLIISANNFYGLLTQQKEKSDSYVSLGKRLNEISNKLMNYES